jgi:hypothetical protein
MGWWERLDEEWNERRIVLTVAAWAVGAIGGTAVYAAIVAALWRAMAG